MNDVMTNVELVSIFFNTIWVSIMRISPFYISRVWVCMYEYVRTYVRMLVSDTIQNLNTKQGSSYQDIITLVLIWYRKTMTQIIDKMYKDSLTLRHPPKTNIWLVLQFQHPWVNNEKPMRNPLLWCLMFDTMYSSTYRRGQLTLGMICSSQ